MAFFEYEGKKYQTQYGSDIDQDGVFVELNRAEAGDYETLLTAFWSYQTHMTTFQCYAEPLPFGVVKKFIEVATERLPPDGFSPPASELDTDD